MSEIVKVVRPVHAEGEYVIMYKDDMVEGDKLYVDPVEAKRLADEQAKAEADALALEAAAKAEAEAKAKAEADANKQKGK